MNDPRTSEDQLINDNLGLVISIAKSFNPPNATELDEYIQVGSIGLWNAIRAHDASRGKLSTVAWHYIKWAIMRYIKQQSKNGPTLELLEEPSDSVHDVVWEYLPSTLSDQERTAVQMKIDGYTYQEIGTKLGGDTRWKAHKIYDSAIRKIRQSHGT